VSKAKVIAKPMTEDDLAAYFPDEPPTVDLSFTEPDPTRLPDGVRVPDNYVPRYVRRDRVEACKHAGYVVHPQQVTPDDRHVSAGPNGQVLMAVHRKTKKAIDDQSLRRAGAQVKKNADDFKQKAGPSYVVPVK
jgi:hypothetical protein